MYLFLNVNADQLTEKNGFPCYGSIELRNEAGSYHYVTKNNLDCYDEIPQELQGLVSKITHREHIVTCSMEKREYGIYQWGSAEARLGYNNNLNANAVPAYVLDVTGTNIQDMKDLITHIKAGTLPPVVSFEKEQGEQSVQQVFWTMFNTKKIPFRKKLSMAVKFLFF